MSLRQAREPAVPRADVDGAEFVRALVDRAPPDAQHEQLAMMWSIRKTMRDGSPAERRQLLSDIKGAIVSTYRQTGGKDEGMAGVVLASLVWPLGDAGAPLVLDLLAGAEPGESEAVRDALAAQALLVLAADAELARTPRAELEFPEEFAGVRMLPERSVSHGLSQHQARLSALLAGAAEQAERLPTEFGTPDKPLGQPRPELLPFLAVAVAGKPLAGLYDFLLELEQRHEGLSADLLIATAAAVAPERLAGNRGAVARFDRVSQRRPHVALIAGAANRDLMAAAAGRAMTTDDPARQLAGVVLAQHVVEGDYPMPDNEGIGAAAVARRLLPQVNALTASPDPRVRAAAAEAKESLELTSESGD